MRACGSCVSTRSSHPTSRNSCSRASPPHAKPPMDAKLLEILVCPLCKGPLVWRKEALELICKADRLAEAVSQLKLGARQIVVNVQGDEPLIAPRLVRRVAEALAARPEASLATAAHPIHSAETFFDTNVVKVVIDSEGFAQYFSRAPIPFARDAFAQTLSVLPPGFPAYRHIGLYAYRVRFLREYATLTPTAPERFWALEHVRDIGQVHRIAVTLWDEPMQPGVDTAEDLERVRRQLIMPG